MPKQTEIIYATPSQPRQLRLDSTCECTATCMSCHRYISKRKGEMSLEFMETVLKDVARWETPLSELVPVNYGDLFCRPDWLAVLQTCARILPVTPITIVTNGALLSVADLGALTSIRTLKIMNFSVNAYFDETYVKFMGLDPSVIPQIRKVMSAIKIMRPDIRLKVSMVFDPRYQTDLERDYFEQYWASLVSFNPAFNKPDVWIIPAASAGRSDNVPYQPVLVPCRSIFSDIVVGFDGKLTSCCFDSGMVIDCGRYSGDLKKDWQNEQLTNLRKIHNSHQRETINLCKRCSFG